MRRLLGSGGISFTSGGATVNIIPKADGAGGLANSSITDNGTTVTTTEPILLPNGTAAAPALSLALHTSTGALWNANVNGMSFSAVGAEVAGFSSGTGAGLALPSTSSIGWTNGTLVGGAYDLFLTRRTTATIQLGAADSASPVSQTIATQGSRGATDTDIAGGSLTIQSGLGTGAGAATSITHSVPGVLTTGTTQQTAIPIEKWTGAATADPANFTATMLGTHGETWVRGVNTELLTLSTIGLTTQTSNSLLPANSIIEAVVCRVTTTITTTTNWAVGDGTTTSRFSSANATLTIGTTSVGLNHWSGAVTTLAAGPSQASAAKVQITCTGSNPGAGVIRITVFYRSFVPPTS